MRIVHIITRLILGGAQENTLISCRLLARRGHEVILITGPALGPEGQLFTEAAGQGYRIIVSNNMLRPIRPLNDLACYYHIKGLLRGLAPDIVHTHSAKAGIIGRYAAAGVKSPGRGNCGIVHTIHGLAFHPYQNRLTNRLYVGIERAAARRTDAFISVADAMTNQALEAGIGTAGQYTTAYSAIDEQGFLAEIGRDRIAEFRNSHGIEAEAVVFVTIARLFELKGHDYIIESARRLAGKYKNACWLFVGEGNLGPYYKRTVEKLGLAERVKFAGLLNPEQIPLAIQSSDVLVHCSLREGLARALPQGMLCGKPVVSFNVDGAPEVVNRHTGMLIEPGDVDGLTEACEVLLINAELRAKLGSRGREQVKTRFAPETMVDTIERVYGKVLAGELTRKRRKQ